MTNHRLSRFADFMRAFGSAVAASGAVERGRAPSTRDLRNLGIDPAQFRAINR